MSETAKRQMEALKEIQKVRELYASAYITEAEMDVQIAALKSVR
jgi:hypothetical protein